jgi:hypothetical protein
VRARLCIERLRYWQAEYWISALRDHALELGCLRCGLEGAYGRGFDQLPIDIRNAAAAALVRSIDRDELLGALAVAVRTLIAEAQTDGAAETHHDDDVRHLAAHLEPQLLKLLQPSPAT